MGVSEAEERRNHGRGWFAAFSATDDRSIATGLSVFVVHAADAATLWPIFH